MCIRDRSLTFAEPVFVEAESRRIGRLQVPDALLETMRAGPCLLYTSDAADERSSVDLGGRRIIKKKQTRTTGASVAYTKKRRHITEIKLST